MSTIKIFLVEDEAIIRNAIKNSIHWEREGYEFVGEAADGELAYPLILKERPDILLTDIKMPFMDGLELSEAVKKELPDIKIIILSGYDDFDFAKKAISIGITDYLLKPVSAEELLKSIREVAVRIEKEREEQELIRKYEEEMEENKEERRRQLLTRLLTQNLPITEILEAGKEVGMDLSAQAYNFMLFKISNLGDADIQQYLIGAFMEVRAYMERQERICCFQRGLEGWAFLFRADGEEELGREIERCRNGLRELLGKFPGVEYFGGIGKPVFRLRELKEAFQEAERVFSERFTAEKNQIVTWQELHGADGDETEVRGLGSMSENRKLIAKFLRNGTEEEVESFVQVYFAEILGDSIKSMIMRQYIMMDIYISMVEFGESLSIKEEEIQEACGDIKSMRENVSTPESMQAYAEKVTRAMLKLRNSASGQRYMEVIEAAILYMGENYMSDEISLGNVAVSVGMSPSYFSSIFSQETGKTFVEYLTGIRMEKAKELLMCSNKKTSEIGFDVGYKDSHYFSYIFKKTQGCSPKEYRSRGRE